MPDRGSITQWINDLKAGDREAAEGLWRRYFSQLVQLARRHLQDAPRRAADEEDVALSAFDSFCQGADRGRFPLLADRANLWPLLVVITRRKALDYAAHERRRRPAGKAVLDQEAQEGTGAVAWLPDPDPTPEFAAEMADELRRLLDRLPDPELRSVAVWKLEGYGNDEIADRLGCVTRTVERKLSLIRGYWADEESAS